MVLHSTKNFSPLWSTPQPKKKSGITAADSEVKPLLATYETSTLKMKKHSGRGKLRFSRYETTNEE